MLRFRPVVRGAIAAGLLLAALAPAPATAMTLEVGDRLDEITLVDRTGARITFDSLAGKIVILDFWAIWCVPCRPALAALDELARRYGANGLVVLAVNADGDREVTESFLANNFQGSTVRFVYDPGRRLISRIGALGLPAVYLLDRERVVRFAAWGGSASDEAALEQEVARLLRPLE